MSELIIHIGMGKAASTTIQRQVLKDPSAPVSIGRFSPHPSLERMWWRGLLAPARGGEAERCKRILEEDFLANHSRVVLSDEIISGSSVLLDNLLCNIAGLDARVKFLLITREQAGFLESLYNHSMRSRVNAVGIPPIHRPMASKLTYHGDLDSWVHDLCQAYDKGDKNILCSLAYDKVVKKLRSVAGEDGVIILPFELLKSKRQKFAMKLATLLKMNPDIVREKFESKENVTGQRIRDFHFGEAINQLMKHPVFVPARRMGLSRKAVVNKIVTLLRMFQLNKKEKLSENSKKAIQMRFGKRNAALEDLIEFDLQQLGYFTD